MEISVSGKHVDVGEALRTHAESELAAAVNKYFEHAIDAHVTLSKDGSDMVVDISVHPGPRGLVVQGSGSAAEAYPAFDTALEHITKQLRRYKRRLVDEQRRRSSSDEFVAAQQYVLQPDHSEEEQDVDVQPVIVAEMQTDISTLSVSEAVMRMDLAGVPVLMFRNVKTNELSVVYHRADGNIGWIDPTPGSST